MLIEELVRQHKAHPAAARIHVPPLPSAGFEDEEDEGQERCLLAVDDAGRKELVRCVWSWPWFAHCGYAVSRDVKALNIA